ncbi:MAG: MCE family protein [Actinomycetota bacterium]|nr:MCE family protein [Actinomycetota bacterium]
MIRSTGAKLTIFTVVTIIVTFWLASVIGKLNPFDKTYPIKAVFSDATGILNGDPVKIAGVDVGKVTSFEVQGGEAIISMEVSAEVELPKNVLAEIKFRNLLGQRILNLIRPEVPSIEPLEAGGIIPVHQTTPALDLSVVFNNLRPLIQSTNPEDINTVARAVLEIFEGRKDDFAKILGNVGEVTQELANRDQRLARLVTHLDELTQILNEESDSIRKGVRKFGELMESLADVTPTIELVVDQLNSASSKFGGILIRNRANLDSELEDLNTVLGIIDDELGPLDTVAKNLKEILLATARTQSYGKWWTLYLPNLCLEEPVGCR